MSKAALRWVIAHTVSVTRRHVIGICVFWDAGSYTHFTPHPIRALAIIAAWRETSLVQSGADEASFAVGVSFTALGHSGTGLIGWDTHKSAHGIRALNLVIRAALHIWARFAFWYTEVSTHTVCTLHVVVWTVLHVWTWLLGVVTEGSELIVADLLVIVAIGAWVVVPAAEAVL